MNECQVWWTITGNFGNMMPIDWSKSTARAKHLPTLNLAKPGLGHGIHKGTGRVGRSAEGGRNRNSSSNEDDLEEEDDIVAADLDMHALILNSNPHDMNVSPPFPTWIRN